jgi:hypothetical protein
MTREDDTPAAFDPADILLAARTTCPVLITALPQDALRIAQAIAAEYGCPDRLLVGEPLDGAQAPELAGTLQRPLMLLLQDIHNLTPRQQELLLELMEDRHGTPPRVLASTSVSLFDLVEQGMFDARLFYRLNVLHVVASPALDDNERARITDR